MRNQLLAKAFCYEKPDVNLRQYIDSDKKDKKISRTVNNGLQLSGSDSSPLVFCSREMQKPGIFRFMTKR